MKPVVHAAILAAGRSSRMGGPNKLLSEFDGVPLIRRVAEAVIASRADACHLVVGYQKEHVAATVSDLMIRSVDNPDFANGLSTSLKAAERGLPDDVDGLLIVLGDMPGVTSGAIDSMIDAFTTSGARSIVWATHAGKRGNPVLLPRALFGEIRTIEGDIGARHLIESATLPVIDIELGEAASLDLDTREAVRAAGGTLVQHT